eukprot:3863902-Rhodomonas_salina.2
MPRMQTTWTRSTPLPDSWKWWLPTTEILRRARIQTSLTLALMGKRRSEGDSSGRGGGQPRDAGRSGRGGGAGAERGGRGGGLLRDSGRGGHGNEFNLLDVVNEQAYHAHTDDSYDYANDCDEQEYDPEEDA